MSGFTNPRAPQLVSWLNDRVWQYGWRTVDKHVWNNMADTVQRVQMRGAIWTRLRNDIQLVVSDAVRLRVQHRIRAEAVR